MKHIFTWLYFKQMVNVRFGLNFKLTNVRPFGPNAITDVSPEVTAVYQVIFQICNDNIDCKIIESQNVSISYTLISV